MIFNYLNTSRWIAFSFTLLTITACQEDSSNKGQLKFSQKEPKDTMHLSFREDGKQLHWRIHTNGANLLGTCENHQCEAHDHKVV